MPEEVRINELDAGWQALLSAAKEAMARAYAPYSRFQVGAAVRTTAGHIYSGSNVENAAYGLTMCAERTAVFKAVTEGERDLEALVVMTNTGSTPCGSCRQVLAEFEPDMPILIADATSDRAWMTSLKELLPDAFPRVNYGDPPGLPHPSGDTQEEPR